MGRKVYSPTWNGWDFGGKVGKYDTWILWVMESYPPRTRLFCECFVKGWRYFDTLESLERPTTLLLWWLLSNPLPLLKADSPEGFLFHLSSISFQGAKCLFHGGFGGLRFGTLFLFGVSVGIIHVQHVLCCCCILWWLGVVFLSKLCLFINLWRWWTIRCFFSMGWIWWFVVWLKRLEGRILLKNRPFSYHGEGIVGNTAEESYPRCQSSISNLCILSMDYSRSGNYSRW